jgi:hypothetical protein
MNEIIVCPHCNDHIIIEKLNCGIFRHGIIKETGKQMDPHSVKTECDDLKAQDLIYGCGKPFRLDIRNGEYIVSICEYI